ncbi:hypothetical protein IU500_05150 [Nocardia terpenica]|uniref:hypothetical protein n=1 Tax=Nocardia terpenica TaxID=455432 RepID=UPI0018944436|nr:hypothetical protein [Nocardia terpenica]MBF6060170.1 hypothetical protein [Nocardia terpenica]MBF6103430.1 hypothetical protein [Nocardia terpenica]MBF6112196.1 hypothetical protein [Nocardia terpenica]MBF6117651.1 hypothetical protein [Nocardia terpenica]MBF6153605.1 hypothetical protein [Nocardia terpenica]
MSVSEVDRRTAIAADPARTTAVADAVGLRIGFERPWKAIEQTSRAALCRGIG